jgi:hemerythrin
MNQPILLKWREEFSLGIDDVDHDHQELIALINELYGRLHTDPTIDEIADFLGEVYARIAAHFALEERIMRDRNYDQYADHKTDHERLLDEIADMIDRCESGELQKPETLGPLLDRWFSEHFKTRDARMHTMLS